MNKIIKRKMMILLIFFAFAGSVFMPVKKVCAAEKNTQVKVSIDVDNINGDSTGVTEVDDSMDRGNSFLEGFVKFIGKGAALISLLFFFISFPTHQTDMRLNAFLAFCVGVLIYFAPEIIHFVFGKH